MVKAAQIISTLKLNYIRLKSFVSFTLDSPYPSYEGYENVARQIEEFMNSEIFLCELLEDDKYALSIMKDSINLIDDSSNQQFIDFAALTSQEHLFLLKNKDNIALPYFLSLPRGLFVFNAADDLTNWKVTICKDKMPDNISNNLSTKEDSKLFSKINLFREAFCVPAQLSKKDNI